MKSILLVFSTVLIFSCAKVQYFTVSSNQGLKNKDQELVIENDTIKISYRFNGYLTMNIYNKASFPLEVNWKKSSFVSGGQAMAYYSPDMKLNGEVRVDNARSLFVTGSGTSAKFEGKASGSSESQFLPPHSNITRYFMVLPNRKLDNLSFEGATNERLKTPSNLNFKFRKLSFNQDNSPFHFRNYLTINAGTSGEFYVDHDFYVSEAWLSGQKPDYLPLDIQDNGDIFCLLRK